MTEVFPYKAVWKPPAPDAELFAKMHGGEEWLIGA